ncbi:thiamine biosynthesis protein MoeB [Lottiidibacillus patelloidae]|uniref:Thiamine biosynthesis protein MoeB n=1 Tax=Lottiidibacillus patelloidae TaxID=2670334 RepID=A0A263BSQ8_9BACI|nr:MoeB/ThiF family adenylyltransferase [Lottiidibacillus patelloidae]OZM56612.1 thiamine biosynthesis protein MoeB [Lottiidibacillus patelloidae]
MNERYSRQELFRPIGENGQNKLRIKHVLILGCGALGTTNAEMLVRAGIGRVTIIDRDYVEFSNLQRQQLFSEQDAIEQIPKAIAAKNRLNNINSDVEIDAYVMDATSSKILPLLKSVDLVIDATDNFDVRLMMNDLLQKQNITWIFGSCVGSMGMSFTIRPGDTPCLNCLLDRAPLTGATCDSVGIISPAVQMVAAHQTTEALKYLVEDFDAMRSSLVTFDLWNNNYQTINVNRAKKETCTTCGTNPSFPYLQYENQTKTEVLCGRETVQIRTGREVNIEDLALRLTKLGKVNLNPFLVSLEYQSYRLVFFKDGRTLIHGTNSIEKAKRLYYQIIG